MNLAHIMNVVKQIGMKWPLREHPYSVIVAIFYLSTRPIAEALANSSSCMRLYVLQTRGTGLGVPRSTTVAELMTTTSDLKVDLCSQGISLV